jgi:hypothetical protein
VGDPIPRSFINQPIPPDNVIALPKTRSLYAVLCQALVDTQSLLTRPLLNFLGSRYPRAPKFAAQSKSIVIFASHRPSKAGEPMALGAYHDSRGLPPTAR